MGTWRLVPDAAPVKPLIRVLWRPASSCPELSLVAPGALSRQLFGLGLPSSWPSRALACAQGPQASSLLKSRVGRVFVFKTLFLNKSTPSMGLELTTLRSRVACSIFRAGQVPLGVFREPGVEAFLRLCLKTGFSLLK